jgi:hypothetical protein
MAENNFDLPGSVLLVGLFLIITLSTVGIKFVFMPIPFLLLFVIHSRSLPSFKGQIVIEYRSVHLKLRTDKQQV